MSKRKLPGNLITLIYAPNSCYTIVTDEWVEGLNIQMKPGGAAMWSYKNPKDDSPRKPREIKIGEYNYNMNHQSSGVIGVYDRMKTEHLSQMVRDSQEITNHRESFDD